MTGEEESIDEKRVHILISGLVQGVWFRSSTRSKAIALGVKGWVRNLPDGRVEVMAEGKEKELKELIKWCYTGPPGASVRDVEVEWSKATGEFSDFVITY